VKPAIWTGIAEFGQRLAATYKDKNGQYFKKRKEE